MPTGFSFVKYAAFSTDGASLVTVTADADVTFQRIEGSVIKTRKGPPFTPFGSRDASTPDVKFLAKFSQNDISLWRPADNQIKKWTAHSDEVTCIALSSDGQYLVSGSKDKAVKLWDHDGNLLKILSGHSEKIASVSFSIDNQTIISYSNDKTVMLWNTDGKLLNTFSIGSTAFSHKAVMSPNGKLIAIDLNSAVGLISPKGAALRQLGGHTSSLLELVFSPDSKIIASASRDKTIKIWSVENGQLLKTLVGHENTINSIGFSPDGRFLVSSSDDSTTRVWNVETGNHLAMLNQGQEWLIFNNDGYFDTSKNGGRLVAMVKGQTAFGIDQFAIKNNRPDLILSQVGIGSQQLIDYFNSRYQRRLKRAGIKEEDLSGEIHIPAVNIKNLKQTGKFVEVDFQLSDSKYNLKRYSLFVNDVPIFGTAGKEISGTSVELTENVELIGGKNKIEISVFNEKGAESYRDFRFIDYQAKVKGDLYYLGFGVSKYKYNELNLGYADQDARDLGALFSKLQKNYGKIQVKTILNEEVTVENIIKAKSFLNTAKVDDTFVLFIAGHGVHDNDKDSTYYYLTHNADVRDLAQTAANFELIEDLLQNIAPRNKLFLMDTCESGEVENNLQQQYYTMAGGRGIKARTTRGISLATKQNAPKRTYLFQKDRFITNDLLRRSGAIVFSSSKGGEFSYESDKIENGYFTEEIIKALTTKSADANSDGAVSIDELRDYVSQEVPKHTENMQHPTVDRDNIFQKFAFPIIE